MLFHRLRAIKSREDDNLASILDAVGVFGTFQRRLVALTFIPNILSGFFLYGDSFMYPAQKAYCNTSWILAVGPNLSEAEQLNLTVPRESNGTFLTCLRYSPVDRDLASIIQFGLNSTERCHDGYIYPESKKRLLVDEFDLVCGKELNRDIVLTISVAGLLIGSVVFGFICDKLGRYPTILLSLMGLMIFGFGTAFVNSLEVYLFFRFCVHQAVAGYTLSSIALVTEWLVSEDRVRVIILSHCYYTVGILFLLGLTYSIPHWRLLFLLGGSPIFSVLPYIWILPESPRWLMVRGKVEKAKQVLCYAASVNKRIIPLNLLNQLQPYNKKMTTSSVLDFFSNRHLRKLIFMINGLWFVIFYNYLTLKVKTLGINPYRRRIISSLIEVPARMCCILLVEQIGRKWALTVTLLQGFLISLFTILLPKELKFVVILAILIEEFIQTASFTLLFTYTAELLPTVLRTTGLGLVTLSLAVGSILSLMIVLINQNSTILPIFFSCFSAVLTVYLCNLMPEMQNQPLIDSVEQFSLQIDLIRDLLYENLTDSPLEDVSEEAAKNAILNTMVPNLDSDTITTKEQQSRGKDL